LPKIVLPNVITDLFHSTALTVDNIVLGKDIWVVYAHGKYSSIKKLTTQSIKAFEDTTPSGNSYFSLYLISKDEKKIPFHICIEDLNLNQKANVRYTNHHAFSSREEAEYYLNLCIEFEIQSMYVLQQINKTV
jgi:hypothetical protein